LIAASCSKSSPDGETPQPGPQGFRGVRIYIISTGDIHEYSPDLAGLSTLVRQVKDTAPETYTVLAGDFFMVHHSYDVRRCGGQLDKGIIPDLKVPDTADRSFDGLAEIRILEYLDFDAIVPGNHDWTYGIIKLRNASFNRSLVASNVGEPAGLCRDFISFSGRKSKYKLNIIGVAATDNIHSKSGENVIVYPVSTSTSVRKLKTACAAGEINVLLTHLQDSDDEGIFTSVVDSRGAVMFDCLCGGHTHKSFAVSKSGALYLKCGLYGTWAGLTCIWWDTVRREVMKKTSKLICLEQIPPDPSLRSLIDSLHRVYPHY
jgi:2',3'-cyclic-nucleotide 2'-phosphodiesterase (5'-nucleotidase family)